MKIPLAIILTCLLAITLAPGAEPKAESASFAAFWVKFKTAVVNNDREAIVGMTKLPFSYNTRPLTKVDFIKKSATIFSREVRRCFQIAKPVKASDRDSYSVFCGQTILLFEKEKGEYRFTDIAVND
jgi:hypothetical protein